VPTEAASITAALDTACWGDTIVVACGTYYEHEMIMKDGVSIVSETGEADCVIVDSEGMGRSFDATLVDNVLFKGLTLTGGNRNWGAGISLNTAPITLENCLIHGNTASWQGGGIIIMYCDPFLRNVTIVGNSAPEGGGMYVYYSAPTIENSIVAFNDGKSVWCSTQAAPQFACTDIFGNTQGDWIDCFAGQLGLAGNISEDPMFCTAHGSYALDAVSPCLPGANSCGVLMGALGEGCQVSGVPEDGPPEQVPTHFFLAQNAPNPFNPVTTIRFGLPAPRHVRLTVYDLVGRPVIRLLDTDLEAGMHEAEWRGHDDRGRRVASGVYIYRIQTDGFEQTRRLSLIK
jgi:hypothetical protein